MNFVALQQSVSFEGHTLILPAISLGNVGQLAIDLVVSTLAIPRVGLLDHPDVLCVAGFDAFSSARPELRLVLSIEVFQDRAQRLTVLQQRAPPRKGRNGVFATALIKWISANKFLNVIVLSSIDASRRIDTQLFGRQLRYVLTASAATPSISNKMHSLNVLPLERFIDGEVSPATNDELKPDEENELLRKGGFSRSLYDAAAESKIPLVLLTAFVTEGNNIPEATDIAECLASLLNFDKAISNGFSGSYVSRGGAPRKMASRED
mmetsp:Transcript_35826/g.59734  ORF Transcript_35826/g.59734 Transcript_35826/m.59734 type:complete len:265 (-) Transcript_35826:1480-2274(-)